jgi:hypothetical protein
MVFLLSSGVCVPQRVVWRESSSGGRSGTPPRAPLQSETVNNWHQPTPWRRRNSGFDNGQKDFDLIVSPADLGNLSLTREGAFTINVDHARPA